jgi:hypothetical protein
MSERQIDMSSEGKTKLQERGKSIQREVNIRGYKQEIDRRLDLDCQTHRLAMHRHTKHTETHTRTYYRQLFKTGHLAFPIIIIPFF